MDSHSLIEKIKNEDGENELREIYRLYRDEFVIWAGKNYSCSDEEAKEVFQQVVVIFYENIISGKLTEVTAHLKTYLFAIGKNKMQQLLRRNARHSSLNYDDYQFDSAIFYTEDEEENMSNIHKVSECLMKLGEPCKTILVALYYKNKDMDEIRRNLNYKNSDTMKSQKYRCLQRLKKIYRNEMRLLK